MSKYCRCRYAVMVGKKYRAPTSYHYTKESAIKAQKRILRVKHKKAWHYNPRVADINRWRFV